MGSSNLYGLLALEDNTVRIFDYNSNTLLASPVYTVN